MTAPAPGVCRFCGITDEQIDGDRVRWLGESRTVCSKPACIRAHYAAVDRRKSEHRQRTRKLSPAEIHALILKKRKRSRQGRGPKGRAA